MEISTTQYKKRKKFQTKSPQGNCLVIIDCHGGHKNGSWKLCVSAKTLAAMDTYMPWVGFKANPLCYRKGVPLWTGS